MAQKGFSIGGTAKLLAGLCLLGLASAPAYAATTYTSVVWGQGGNSGTGTLGSVTVTVSTTASGNTYMNPVPGWSSDPASDAGGTINYSSETGDTLGTNGPATNQSIAFSAPVVNPVLLFDFPTNGMSIVFPGGSTVTTVSSSQCSLSSVTITCVGATRSNLNGIAVQLTGTFGPGTPITFTYGDTAGAATNGFSVALNPTLILKVGLGQCVPFPVTLAAPAGPSGAALTLTSSNASIVDFSPGVNPVVVVIPAGDTSPQRNEIPQVCGVSFGTATVSAAPAVSQTVIVQVTATLSFAQASSTVTNGRQGRIELDLSVPSPAPGGLTVTLTSSNAAVATVPATIVIPANQTSVIVPVTTVSTGSTTITASDPPNVPAATTSLTVQ